MLCQGIPLLKVPTYSHFITILFSLRKLFITYYFLISPARKYYTLLNDYAKNVKSNRSQIFFAKRAISAVQIYEGRHKIVFAQPSAVAHFI